MAFIINGSVALTRRAIDIMRKMMKCIIYAFHCVANALPICLPETSRIFKEALFSENLI